MTTAERLKAFPNVPTAKEQGIDVTLAMWRGLAAPKGTPAPVVKKLQDAAKKATESDAFKSAMDKLGADIRFLDHNEFGKLITEDDQRLDKIMTGLGLKKGSKS
jgi:tripartite-type tricarboxylate transporter receptor subunit TctC